MYLIDTDTIIYSLKDDKQVNTRFLETKKVQKSISVITWGAGLRLRAKSNIAERILRRYMCG